MMFSFLELREVRKACDMLKEKEDVEGELKLEDEKNDGMNNVHCLDMLFKGLFHVTGHWK
ncbi:hypothetical protein Hanom_Chr04g00321341 [Helianthus anomalus]